MTTLAMSKPVDWETAVIAAQQLHKGMASVGLSTENACAALLVAYWVAITGEIPNTEATDARARAAVNAISQYAITIAAEGKAQ